MPKQLELEAGESQVVAKANRLIQGRHDLTTAEQRIFAAMVAKLDRSTKEFSVQEIRVKRICDLSGINASNFYRKIDKVTDNLVEKTISVRHRDRDGEEVSFEKYPIFSLCKYKRGSGVVRARFNDEMRPHLLNLRKRFTLYLVTIFLRLRSTYSMKIYELLKMREDLRRHRLSVEELRETLSLKHKYDRFADLKRRVLEKAREELKEKADIYFTYKVERENYVPVAVEFFIHENEDVVAEMEAEHGLLGMNKGQEGAEGGEREEGGESDSKHGEPPQNPDAPQAANAEVMFLENLSQSELRQLDQEKVNELYEKARDRVERREGKDLQSAYLEGMTGREMQRIWAEE